jgi:hypothetical protein
MRFRTLFTRIPYHSSDFTQKYPISCTREGTSGNGQVTTSSYAVPKTCKTDTDGTQKEAKEMYHFMEFDPYLVRQRNQQIFNEVQALRFEKWLRKSHKVGGSKLAAFTLFLKSTLHPLRRAGTARR